MSAEPSWEQSLLGDDKSVHTLMLPVSVLFTAATAKRRDQLAWGAMRAYGLCQPTKLHVAGKLRHFETPTRASLSFLHIETKDDVRGCPGMHRIVAEDVAQRGDDASEVINALLALLDVSESSDLEELFEIGGPIIEPALWLTFLGWPNAIVLRESEQWQFSEELLELARS